MAKTLSREKDKEGLLGLKKIDPCGLQLWRLFLSTRPATESPSNEMEPKASKRPAKYGHKDMLLLLEAVTQANASHCNPAMGFGLLHG